MKQIKELINYGFWGGISTLINLGLFYAFIYFNMQYVVANVVSFIIAVIFSYYFNLFFVFKSSKDEQTKKQLKFYIMRTISIFVDSLILVYLHETLGLDLVISKIIDSIIVIGSTFILNKFLIFKK